MVSEPHKYHQYFNDFDTYPTLQSIYDEGIDELKYKASLARKYFDSVIVEYFKDPTLFFLKWLNSAK